MANLVNYASSPTVGVCLLTTGDTSRTAPATFGTLFTPAGGAGNAGAQIERIVVIPVASTTATVVRIFRHDGSTAHLYTEIQIAAQTLVGGTAVVPQTIEAVTTPNLIPILLPAGWTLRATVNDTQGGIKVSAEGGSY